MMDTTCAGESSAWGRDQAERYVLPKNGYCAKLMQIFETLTALLKIVRKTEPGAITFVSHELRGRKATSGRHATIDPLVGRRSFRMEFENSNIVENKFDYSGIVLFNPFCKCQATARIYAYELSSANIIS
eukprot:scaffold2080_cov49-Cylindrotheca_fusiformis.AAC.1